MAPRYNAEDQLSRIAIFDRRVFAVSVISPGRAGYEDRRLLLGPAAGPDRYSGKIERGGSKLRHGPRRQYDRRVRSIGIDLAWGTKAQTGLAALDEAGRLLDVTDASTDDDIAAWMDTYAPTACLAAIDAPIIVTNATGSRRCDREVTQYFGRHHAGTHPANTANPLFTHGATRARRLTTRLGLDVNPYSTQSRRALEVFPHSAVVALFELTYILRYKQKRGRTFSLLQSETTQLLERLETLGNASPPLLLNQNERWHAIRTTVQSAATKAELRRVEDRIDAVVCAYVALLATQTPQRIHIFGDVESGYIATPLTAEAARRLKSATLRRSQSFTQASPAAPDAAEQIHG
jgi:predicted RNase H-like nuclease